MAQPLEAVARHTFFVFKDAPQTRKLSLSSEWQTQSFVNVGEILLFLKGAQNSRQSTILVLAEEDFHTTVLALEQKVPLSTLGAFGVVVLAKDEATFLREKGANPSMLDVVNDKEFRKNPEFHLLRALRLLLKMVEKGRQKISQKTLEHLNEVFIDLSAERDPQRLLSTIVHKAMELTQAVGGTLYMVNETDGELFFRIRVTSNVGQDTILEPVALKVTENHLCGYVALTGKLINVPDVKNLKPLSLPQFQKSVDHSSKEDTFSLLTIPLKNSRHEIVAVLQLTNKSSETEDAPPMSFEIEDESLIASFAAQAAICLENVDLYADIRRLFEGFVRAAISAIESRDPSTGGHSERVARMSVALARATTECGAGIYRSVKFREEEIRELEYAALLHDFGKIGVREEVLVKAKKLYPFQLDAIQDRIKICKAAAKISYLEKKARGSSGDLEREYQQRLRDIDTFWEIILSANEPTILKRENIEALDKIRSEQMLLPDGSLVGVLTEDEYKALSVTRGSLTDSERLEIESHVRHTYQFLKMIPWTKDFRHLTEIAYCHHEKLDGSGYPRGLTAHEIPLQSKIMTISDIFDALTAADRWYKEAVPMQKALDILRIEVNQGKMDPILFELFVERKIYELPQQKELIRVA